MGFSQTFVHKGRELHLDAYEGAGAANGASGGAQRLGVRAPGAGHFEFSGLQAEWAGDTIALTGQVTGKNLAYLYTEVLLKDPAEDRYYGPVMRDYIRSERNEGSTGITRPVWDESVEMKVSLRPLLRLATDGAHSRRDTPAPATARGASTRWRVILSRCAPCWASAGTAALSGPSPTPSTTGAPAPKC
jgi:hypothetical protein